MVFDMDIDNGSKQEFFDELYAEEVENWDCKELGLRVEKPMEPYDPVSAMQHRYEHRTLSKRPRDLSPSLVAYRSKLRKRKNASPVDANNDAQRQEVAEDDSAQHRRKRRRVSPARDDRSSEIALAWPYVKPSSPEEHAYILRLQERVALLQTKGGKKAKKVKKATDAQIRGAGLMFLSASERIFAGLRFRFYPQENVWPLREPLINEALSYGAEMVTGWWESTHILVRPDISISDLFSKFGVTGFPSTIVVVKDNYQTECIRQFKCVVEPRQERYRVRGDAPLAPPPEQPVAEQPPVPSESESAAAPSSNLREVRPSLNSGMVVDPAQKPFLLRKLRHARQRHENTDELEQAIEEAKAVEFVRMEDLESDQNDDGRSSRLGDFTSDEAPSESETRAEHAKLPKGSSKHSWQEAFLCMEKHDGTTPDGDPNAFTIAKLQELADYYERIRDSWRPLAYRKAIAALCRQKQRIVFKEDAESIKGIGKSIAAKIQEIALTNGLRLLENTSSGPKDKALQSFLQVYGAGHTQALKWIGQGFMTIEDLKTKAELTRNQRVGAEHYEDFLTRIPRSEVEEHGRFVKSALSQVSPSLQATIGGSYRRGAQDSGDVDFIITAPDMSIDALRNVILEEFIPRMFEAGYLKASLVTASSDKGSKWHGAAMLPGSTPPIWRRIDFLFVPWDEMGAALIYFTGNDIFNRSIRLLANKKGMRLNQRGLWKDVMRGPGRQRLTQGTLLESRSEKMIFAHLGVPWRPPEYRVC